MGIVRPTIESMEDSPILEVWRMGFTTEGVIGMWAGEPDVPTPDFICNAAMESLKAGNTFYTHNRGIPELRKAIASYIKRLWSVDVDDSRIAVTSAGMNAVVLTSQAIVGPGGGAVCVTPSWPNIMRTIQVGGGHVVEVAMKHGNSGWSLDLDAVMAACDATTKLIYLATPGNPTGWMISRDEAERLLAFCRQRGIALLSDEVYHRLVYDRPVAFSFLEIARPDDPVFVVNSFSKAWAMTGWRMGWLVYPSGVAPQFEKLIQFNTSGGQAFLQAGGVAAITQGEAFVASFLERCRVGRDIVNRRLARMPKIRNIPNTGAFYAMFEVEGVSDTLQFCKRAVTEARIGLAPGVAFGKGAEKLIRLCYAKSPENLEEAMNRLEKFVAAYREA